jgi:hypothetical protein
MSLYYVQKLRYQINRDPHVQTRHATERDELLRDYDPTAEEIEPITIFAVGATIATMNLG